MIKPGVSTACLYPLYTEKALEKVGEMGVKHSEVFFNSHCEIKKDFILDLKKTADNFGITIPSIHPFSSWCEPVMFFSPYERRFDDVMEYYKHYFEAANVLGAKILVFHGDSLHHITENALYFERFKKLYDLGKTFGITVAQENVSRCKSGELPFLLEMKKELKDDLKFVFDTKQAVRKNYNPYGFYEGIKDSIIHIHISDYGDMGDCLFLGDGVLDYTKFIKTLTENNYSGSIMLELYRDRFEDYENKLIKNIDYLNKITLDYAK